MEHSSSTSCLKCGPEFEHNDAPHVVVAAQQQQRIEELESQVRFLTEKASAAGKSNGKERKMKISPPGLV